MVNKTISNHRVPPSFQRGAILLTTLILLVIMTLLGLTTIRKTIIDERIAANNQQILRLFQSADSGISVANDIDLNPNNTTEIQEQMDGFSITISAQLRQIGKISRTANRRQLYGAGYRSFNFEISSVAEPTNTQGGRSGHAEIRAGISQIAPEQ